MSIWVSLNMTVREGAKPDFDTFLDAKLPAVRGFDGALSVTVFGNGESRELLILEEWKSQAHHKNYIEAITANGVMNQLVAFMESPPEVRYFDRPAI